MKQARECGEEASSAGEKLPLRFRDVLISLVFSIYNNTRPLQLAGTHTPFLNLLRVGYDGIETNVKGNSFFCNITAQKCCRNGSVSSADAAVSPDPTTT